MKINSLFPGFNISAKGLSIQRKRMNLIAENIANADITRTADGQPYKRKFLSVTAKENSFGSNLMEAGSNMQLNATDPSHITRLSEPLFDSNTGQYSFNFQEKTDRTPGEVVYQPDSPNADENGYVQESNVNIVNEMVDMISASRSYEANLMALNSSKDMVKNSLEI